MLPSVEPKELGWCGQIHSFTLRVCVQTCYPPHLQIRHPHLHAPGLLCFEKAQYMKQAANRQIFPISKGFGK